MRRIVVGLLAALITMPAAGGGAQEAQSPAADAAADRQAEPAATDEGSQKKKVADSTDQTVDLPYQWIEVAEGVFAALQPEGNRFNDSNSVVIVGDGGVVVIDSQNYPASNRALIEQIRRVTDQPVRYLINSHWHGDHTQGNAVYRAAFPDVEIIGHETLVEDVPGRAAPQLEEQMEPYRTAIPEAEERLRQGVSRSGEPLDEEGRERLAGQIAAARDRLAEMEAVEFVTPSRVVSDRFMLEVGERLIDVRPYRAHTRGDLVIFLPREKILVTGDVLDDLPYGGHGYPREWVAALDELAGLDFDVVIPGHGRLRRGKAHLERVRDVFASIVSQAEREAARAEGNLAQLRANIDLAPFRQTLAGADPIANQAFDEFIPPAIERAWLEARGELED